MNTVETFWQTVQSHRGLFGAVGGLLGIVVLSWAVVKSSYRHR